MYIFGFCKSKLIVVFFIIFFIGIFYIMSLVEKEVLVVEFMFLKVLFNSYFEFLIYENLFV